MSEVNIETVKVELNVGKETKDCIDAVTSLIKDIKDKKDLTTIISTSLPNLVKAVDGVEKVDDEMKSEAKVDTIAYAGREVYKSLA